MRSHVKADRGHPERCSTDASPLKSTKRRQSRRIRVDALQYASRVWEAIDTPLSLGLYLRAKYKEFKDLVSVDVDPLDYRRPAEFFADYQSAKLLSQYPYLDTGINLRKEGEKKFIAAEESCSRTNERFRLRTQGCVANPRVEQVLSLAQQKIAHILGPIPSLEQLDFSFGPGANLGVRGDTSVFDKVSATLECTYAFSSVAGEFLAEFPGWIAPDSVATLHPVNGSELTFVPKNAKTDRPICIEPLLNGLYQKGVGLYLKERLRRFGVNLLDQSINQRLAKTAVFRELSTVDFSSASDTIAFNLVLDLLPCEWFEFLDVARSPCFYYEGEWYPFQKFTSMGNAYTFELETLIFYALACASSEVCGIEVRTGENLHVYGDDVIVPQGAFDLFAEVSEYCGFELNRQKTFREGVFYESCGCDYFLGDNVRPYRLKRRLNQPLEAIYAANTLRRMSVRFSLLGDEVRASSVLAHYPWVVGEIPEKYRVLGPEGQGDGHLIASFDEAAPQRHAYFDAWRYRTVVKVPRKKHVDDVPAGYALYGTRTQEPLLPWQQRLDRLIHSRRKSVPSFDGDIPLRSGETLRFVSPFTFEWMDWRPMWWRH